MAVMQVSQLPAAGRATRFQGSSRPRVTAVRAASKHGYKVVVVGGGSGGAAVAAHYARKLPGQVAVVEPSGQHFYQPLWTLVGGGFKSAGDSVRPMGSVLPPGADWLRTGVTEFDPERHRVTTSDGHVVKYDYLVVATGIQSKWEKVKGLPEALGDGKVVSNVGFKTAPLTFKAVSQLERGRAVFTMPKGAVKCPGAGHKVCYISEDNFRRRGVRGAIDVTFAMAADKLFGVPRYAETIQQVVDERGINVRLRTNLVEVRAGASEAVFEVLSNGSGGAPAGAPVGEAVLRYDLLHVVPPMGPVDAVARSALANEEGYVSVDQETLQHTRYSNVFALGDCTSAPTSKTAAAAAAQFLVVRDHLDALMTGAPRPSLRYDGYTCCPLITKEGATMMMEFGYGGSILETFTPLGIVDQSKEEPLMWMVKKDLLPWAYWTFMTKGYVPWGEYKNALKRLRPSSAATPARPEAPRAAPPRPESPPAYTSSR